MVWSQAREIIANLRRLDVMNGLLQLPQQQQQQPVTRLRGRGKGDSCPRRVQQARGRKTASPQIFYDQRTQKTDGHFCDAPSVSEFFFLARAPAGVWRGRSSLLLPRAPRTLVTPLAAEVPLTSARSLPSPRRPRGLTRSVHLSLRSSSTQQQLRALSESEDG